jgi:flagellar capping protein FliD
VIAMSDITSSSTYSVGNQSYSNKGLSSLVSGMDTDSMVKKLLSGTQSKIDKQQQSKQVLEWKQDMYRDVITSINKFQSTYFGSSAKTDFTNSDFFNSMVSTVTSGSDCVKITGSSPDASTGNMTVEVTALASAAKIAGSGNLSKNFVSGSISSDSLKNFEPRTVAFDIGNTMTKIDLSGVTNTTDMVNRLNQKLNSQGVSVQLSTSGTLSFITDSKDISVKVNKDNSTTTGLSTIGLTNTSASSDSDTLNAEILYGSSAPDATVGNTFTITLNGVSKQISIDPVADEDGKITQDAVKKALANSIATAYGGTIGKDSNGNATVTGGYINLTFKADGKFDLTATDTSSQFTVTGMKAANIGIAPGTSSRVDSFSTLKEIVTNGGTDGTAGDLYKFTINGQEFSFTGSDTLYTVMNAVNNSSAGVKMSYSSLSDTFQMEATSTGANYNISIQQTAGNLFTKLLGKRQETANGLSVYQNASKDKYYYNDPTTNKWYSDSSKKTEVVIDQSTLNKVLTNIDTVAAGSSAGSDALGTTKIEGNTSLLSGTMSSASFKLNVNGKDYSFNVPTKTDGSTYSVSSIISTINEGLKTQFDSTGSVANISIDASTGNLLINNGSIVKFAQSTVATNKSDKVKSAQDTDLAYRLGFSVSGKTNIATASTTVDQLSETVQNALKAANGSITNNTVLYSPNSADTTVASLLHLDFDTNANRFIGTASNLSAQSTLFKSVNAAYLGTGAKASTTGADSVGTAGSDAQAKVNGTTITRSSNSFTIDGVSMELTKKTAAGSPATISTSRDSDTIVKSVKQFVDDYNTLVKALRDQTDSDATYRKYAPLTDAQKAEMKDSEITSWEKNAKTGLLRNDDDILSFLNDMRSALYTKPTNSNYAMYDIGIETEEYSSGSSSLGTLTFDETAFRKALSDDPQSVANLFTDKESGVASQLSSICDATAKVSLSSPGSLVQLAGVTTKSWSTKNNDIYNQIKDIDDKITDLKAKYEDERTRYWNKFNSMEAILSNYNSQSSWLTSQFSS